jgi:hypothetical protein
VTCLFVLAAAILGKDAGNGYAPRCSQYHVELSS